MRAVAAVLAAWALGTLVSGQASAQYYGPGSNDDGAGPSNFYNDRSGPGFDGRTDQPSYRGGDENFDEPNREEPTRRYLRDNQSGEWRLVSRQSWSGDDRPPYRDLREDRYPRDGRNMQDDRYRRDGRFDESQPSRRRFDEPRERERAYDPRERGRGPVPSSDRSRQWWTPESSRRASADDAFKSAPRAIPRGAPAGGVRPAPESMVTISAAEYRELQNQARELREMRQLPSPRGGFPDAPVPRLEPQPRGN
jgi:hypothetical protein